VSEKPKGSINANAGASFVPASSRPSEDLDHLGIEPSSTANQAEAVKSVRKFYDSVTESVV
jgi:hypothetical protein